MSKITNKVLNLVTSLSLFLFVYSLFILRGIQPEGYTVNIYEQLPFDFYLSLLLCYLLACVLLLAYRKMSVVLLLLLVHITVLITPYMLGYVSIGRGEEFSYIGLAGQGSLCNLSGLSNFSPTGPLLVSALALVSGLKTSALSYFLPVFFSIVFIIGMFLFYRIFMSREKLVLTAFLCSTVLYFGHFQTSAASYYLTFCLVPLYLLVLRSALSDKNRAMAVCLLLMIPLIPLAHPFIFAYLVCFSIFLLFSSMMKPGFLHKLLSPNFLSSGAPRFAGRKIPLFIFLLLISGGFLFCAKYVPQFFSTFTSDLISRARMLLIASLSRIPKTENGFLEFVHLLTLDYGKYYIPLILILINSVIVWQNRKRFCHHFVRRYPRFLALYIATFFVEMAFLLNPFIPYPTDLFANLSFVIFAQIPLLGYSLYIVFLRKGYTLGLCSAVLVLCLLWTLGFFTCFSSPYSHGVSEAISQNEVQGIQWLSGVRETYPYVMSSINLDESSISSGILGSNKTRTAEFAWSSQKLPYASQNDSEDVISIEKTAENKPFYVVKTTFSDALSSKAQGPDKTSISAGENTLKAQADYPLYKIYDSLNIEIYEHIP